jgi:hypothetical protein
MLNGPCGGSREDRCEVRPDVPCAWQLIYVRMKEIGLLGCSEEFGERIHKCLHRRLYSR